MKRRARDNEIFSLAFLDVITCGFGAVVLLLLIANTGVGESEKAGDIGALFKQTFAAEETIKDLSAELAQLNAQLNEQQGTNKATLIVRRALLAQVQQKQRQLAQLQNEAKGLVAIQKSQQSASISQDSTDERDEEVGGIPVDSDYVIFIIDTSGSMQSIWKRVMREMENVLDIHPTVKGFQVINDNGLYLINGYSRKWIPDTPERRKNVLRVLANWSSFSNSSPVEGLEEALRTYAKVSQATSIYIFGDDYSGASYDPVMSTLTKLNANRITGQPIVKVHAVGFISGGGASRFSTLMREVTKRNNGTFIGLSGN